MTTELQMTPFVILTDNNQKSFDIPKSDHLIIIKPWKYPEKINVSESTLEQLFSNSLTDTPCIYLNKERETNVAIEMCVQYLESSVDSIVVRDDELNPIGMIGGIDLLHHIRKNPTPDSQHEMKVKQTMSNELLIVDKDMTFQSLMEKWRSSGRAFAIIPNAFHGYSPISARKMLEIGVKTNTNASISSLPKKKMITFQSDNSLREIIDLMFENNTRKLLLEYSDQFISDRVILKQISKILKFQPEIDNLLDISIKDMELDHTEVILEDLNLNRICEKMYEMEHPYLIYKDTSITPWDICNVLESESFSKSNESTSEKITCPHCGKNIDLQS